MKAHCQQALKFVALFFIGLFPTLLFGGDLQQQHSDPLASILLWVTLIFFCAITGRYIAKRLNQPGVLGELLIGVFLGNLCYYFNLQLVVVLREGAAIFDIMREMLAGSSLTQAVNDSIADPYYANQMKVALSDGHGIEFVKVSYVLDVFSRYGVIFLLFKVGLESSIHELKNTGREACRVAIIGVIAPTILGFFVVRLLTPHAPYQSDLFVAAALSATSVGITASVLKEMKKLQTREARIILGAAMIDDVLGLIILSIVSSMVLNGAVDGAVVARIVVSVVCFFLATVMVGPWVLRKAIRWFQFMEFWEARLFISFIFVMVLAWLATVVHLAAIIGAFMAGLIIHDGYFESSGSSGRAKVAGLSIKNLISPLESILAPLFFILIGIQVKLESFFNWQVLIMAAGLIMVAIIGKLMSGIGGNRKDDHLLIGIGMLPRGEVGLVFASLGRTLGVMSDQLFSAIILMVIVTTIIAPPLLKTRYRTH